MWLPGWLWLCVVLQRLAGAITSVGAAGENSQEHSRDGHAATYVGERVLHADEVNDV